MAQQIDSALLMDILNEITEKLGYGRLKSITIRTGDLSQTEIQIMNV